MENAWLKEKIREELEVEYKQKLNEVVAHMPKVFSQPPAEINPVVQSEDIADGSRTLNPIWSKDGEDKPPYSVLVAKRDKHA